MQYHAGMFRQKEDTTRLRARYRTSLSLWRRAGDTAKVLRHTFHVSSWLGFACPELRVFKDLAALHTEYLDAGRGAALTARLHIVLRHVHELLQDAVESGSNWAAPDLEAVAGCLAGEAATRTPQRTTGQLPRGTHGRTDAALVRRVLGDRRVPDGYAIRWSGYSGRWLGSRGKKGVVGSNAVTTGMGKKANKVRFATDADAIEHVYRAILRDVAARVGGMA